MSKYRIFSRWPTWSRWRAVQPKPHGERFPFDSAGLVFEDKDSAEAAAAGMRTANAGEYEVRSVDEDPDRCTDPGGHEFAYSGTAYGGDDESYHGEGRCYTLRRGRRRMIRFDFSNPEHWTLKAVCYLASPSEDNADYWAEVMDEIAYLNDAWETAECWHWKQVRKHVTPGSRFATKGTCDHCGASFLYGAAYENEQGQVAIVGHTCAANYLCLSSAAYEDKALRKAVQAAKTKAILKVKRAKNEAALLKLHAHLQADLSNDHDVSRDLRRSFIEYGELSDKQWALAARVRAEAWGAPKPGEPEPAPIPTDVFEGRATIEGVLLATKLVDSYMGQALKMLVRDDRGFKVWGSYPRFRDDTYPDKGARIRFDAAIEQSKDDATFGFFKRPTKAVSLDKITEAA